MTQRIPNEAVEQALLKWWKLPHFERVNPRYLEGRIQLMRAALEASGAVFLTDEEREAVVRFIGLADLIFASNEHVLSAREKLL